MAGFRAGDLDKYEWRYSESADGEATEEEGSFRGGVAGGSWIFSFLLPNGKRAMGKEEESCRKDYISNSFFFFFPGNKNSVYVVEDRSDRKLDSEEVQQCVSGAGEESGCFKEVWRNKNHNCEWERWSRLCEAP